MNLQTKIPLKRQLHNQIDYNSKILLLGSCFSENIGDKFNYFKFQSTQNPFGILFHPIAIEKLITNAINEKRYTEKDIISQNERWHSFDAHSSVSTTGKQELLQNLNSRIYSTKKQLVEVSHIIITLGTSWVYRHIKSDTIVTNCHKIPQKKFLKELLTVDEISESLASCVALIRTINKDVNFIFTVSPVRHLKDGFVENTQSKAHLIAAIHQVVEPRKKSYYFPSYEIVMDELRDYRFYNEDMVHPNKIAINYIWERFVETWFSEDTKPILKEVDTIQKGISHKPFNENSKQHQEFLQSLLSKKEKITQQFSFIKF
ncbi:GSCFA domain-containing protein [Polaribacter porphyrae]|uniref:GSCFA domain-containing protein n=1 Tax=Polaribacter porphyrae TaxID=1137780 RepID=A0A2S7WPS4_9FLAO|nr:GSCFA domain-containing protein [Polaribacter porphyrae]PQJ79618.1 GSCFA domain-containing protein [Polaribacter porphyrae]